MGDDPLESLSPRARERLEGAVRAIQGGEAEVSLSSVAIGPPGAALLSAAIRATSALEKLEVDRCSLGPEGAWEISDALAANASVTFLDIGENDIQGQGLERLCAVLAKNCSLKTLILCGNDLYPEDGATIGDMLRANGALEHLDLSACDLQGGASHVAAALAENSSVTWVDLGANALTEEEAHPLAEALAVNGGVRFLGLADNDELTGAAVARICRALRGNPGSRVAALDISGLGLGPEDFPPVLDWIRESTVVERINLESNRIGDALAADLAGVAATHASLAALGLEFTGCGANAAVRLAEAIEANMRLVSVSVFGGDLTPASLEALARAAEKAGLAWDEKARRVGSRVFDGMR